MACEDKSEVSETTQQAPADDPKERTPEEEREISSKEAKGASAENDDG